MNIEKPALPFYERLFALGVVGFFMLLIGVNLWLSEREPMVDLEHPYYLQNELIEVVIEGKVKQPGIYQVKKGTTVKEVIQLAELADDANVGKIKLDAKITRRRKIKIR